MIERDFGALLFALHDADVEFLVVGGLAAVLNGTPVHTYDVDVVHRRTEENVDRIMGVLDGVQGIYRIQPERRLLPAKSALLSTGHQNLITKYGPLDLLGTIGNNLGYDELLPHSRDMLIDKCAWVHVLNLETLIELKEQLGGEKDRAMLPLLRATLQEKKRRDTQ
jgi:hypothetical protein